MTDVNAIELAKAIQGGKAATPDEARVLIAALHRDRQFGLARKVLETLGKNATFARVVDTNPALKLELARKRALSTYKDPDLQTDSKLQRALEILQNADDLASTVQQETLGLAGAIHKRLWEHTGREQQLEISLAFYRRGYEQGLARDQGYTAINAAFILDVLADLQSPDAPTTPSSLRSAQQLRSEAHHIRSQIVSTLAATADADWWLLVTLGEAYFGLGQYDDAERYLQRAAVLPDTPDWELESAARQLALLLHIQQRARTPKDVALDARAEQVLSKFLGNAVPALESVLRGKLGLALSGGGFRASLYHIGVLARLADLDLLRHVESLSCVSGGSIIGAHYYLEVRKLLQDKRDEQITRQDYIDIVARVCDDFLLGVQSNIRVRIAAEWLTNLKMIFLPNYSRTKRAGELYEKQLFARVRDGGGAQPRYLNELRVLPKDERADFRPKDHNWRRAAKVPILVLNATSLNTGHNWQFTVSWMGEPPTGLDAEVDANYRLRRMYYEQAPTPYDRMRLGDAVAASACVPGIFEPLSLGNLYQATSAASQTKPMVRLVDGGVHDNQGVASLLEQCCSVLLVSDASGQMESQDSPSNGILGVPLRANSILQERIRISQFAELDSRRQAGTLKGLMFIHLKKDLEVKPVDWVNCQDPSDPLSPKPLTSYNIQRDIQRKLAAMRTDLDSFSDAEGYALMTSGYLMTQESLQQPILGFAVAPTTRSAWKFLALEGRMQQPVVGNPLQQQLQVADRLAFKVWLLLRPLQVAAGVVGLLLLYFLFFAIKNSWGTPFVYQTTLSSLLLSVGSTLATMLGMSAIAKLANYRKTVQQVLIGIGMATIGFVIARLHLHVFDKLFLWQGKVSRLLNRQ